MNPEVRLLEVWFKRLDGDQEFLERDAGSEYEDSVSRKDAVRKESGTGKRTSLSLHPFLICIPFLSDYALRTFSSFCIRWSG